MLWWQYSIWSSCIMIFYISTSVHEHCHWKLGSQKSKIDMLISRAWTGQTCEVIIWTEMFKQVKPGRHVVVVVFHSNGACFIWLLLSGENLPVLYSGTAWLTLDDQLDVHSMYNGIFDIDYWYRNPNPTWKKQKNISKLNKHYTKQKQHVTDSWQSRCCLVIL